MANEIGQILNERGKRYGNFHEHAEITQVIKKVILEGRHLSALSSGRVITRVGIMKHDQIECLEMIAHKLGRILNGDPNYEDSWRDIAGYATLVADRLLAEQDCG